MRPNITRCTYLIPSKPSKKGLMVKELEPMIGRSNHAYEILNRTRPLTLMRHLQNTGN